jgi:CHAT domain-containing protein
MTDRSARRLSLGSLALLIALAALSPSAAAAPEPSLVDGVAAYDRGALDEAVTIFTAVAAAAHRSQRPAAHLTALTHLGQAYAALGQYRQAVGALEAGLAVAERHGNPGALASVLATLGEVAVAVAPPETAEAYLRRSLELATRAGDDRLAAAIHNNLGNLFAGRKKPGEALVAYGQSLALAERAQHRPLALRVRINTATLESEAGRAEQARALLDAALADVRSQPPSHDTAFALTGIALGYRRLRAQLPDLRDRLSLDAAAVLNDAAAMSARLGDRRVTSYALGHLGALYEDEGRHAEALRLTRRAVFAAQQANAPESLYRWQWQAGRLLRAQGKLDDAIGSYRRAVKTLEGIRPELSAAGGAPHATFRDSVGPVYFEFVDLLLQRSAARPTVQAGVPDLKEARETVELVKIAELRDYFRDDCVDVALAKVTDLDAVSATTAVIYPILLPDRTELLVTLPSGLRRYRVAVGAEALTKEVRQLRLRLEKKTTRQYLPHAQQLYRWLVAPLEADLAALKIDTLVLVPDGPLRTIPLAALHDGTRFLVARYGLAVTPGLKMTDPRPLARDKTKVLAVGVSQSVQGFPPLPNVSEELATLRTLFGSTTLVDKDFLLATFEQKLREERFNIVHVASHGEFGTDVDDTFLLAFDQRVTMARLDQLVGLFRYRDDPLELLTLSACDTAAGDDRAALGLAGVAIRAGARSAVATLWEINDDASAHLVAELYRGLQDPAVSRAAALQRAQLKILADPRYEHPGFWAPFLLINNWL